MYNVQNIGRSFNEQESAPKPWPIHPLLSSSSTDPPKLIQHQTELSSDSSTRDRNGGYCETVTNSVVSHSHTGNFKENLTSTIKCASNSENCRDPATQNQEMTICNRENQSHELDDTGSSVSKHGCGEFFLACLPWRRRRAALGSTRQEVRQHSRGIRTDAAALASQAFDSTSGTCGLASSSRDSCERCEACLCGCGGAGLVTRVDALERALQSILADQTALRILLSTRISQSVGEDEAEGCAPTPLSEGLAGRVEALEMAQRRLVARRAAAMEALGASRARRAKRGGRVLRESRR